MPSMYPFDSTLLDTNKVPEDKDMHAIQKVCTEYSQDLEQMNAQIQRLESMLLSITQKRDALQCKVSSLKSIISPLRSLPVEILQRVFQNCLESFPTISTQESPLLLTRICSRWRSVAINTPELWAAIHVVVPKAVHALEPHGAKYAGIREGLQSFLSQSGSLPLSISLQSATDGVYQNDTEETTRTLELLMPFHRRWKYLNFRVSLVSLVPLQYLRGEDVPSLETVTISRSHARGEQDFPEVRLPFLDNAPHFRKLWVASGFSSFKLTRPADWGKLTHLTVLYLDILLNDLVDIVAICPNLTECSIPLGGDFDRSTSLTLYKLQKLMITYSFMNANTASRFFNLLTAPVLREFKMDAGGTFSLDSWPTVLASIQNLFLRSACPLTKFSLKGSLDPPSLPEGFMRSMLQSMPNLEALEFMNCYFMTNDLLKALSVVLPASDVICPRLIRVQFRDTYAFFEEALMEFLSVRRSPPPLSAITPLAQVIVEDPRPSLSSRVAQFGKTVEFRAPSSSSVHMDVRNQQIWGRPTSQTSTALRSL
ncbi:hypothetical protein D9758_001577 [Tetrapyrgos nigripes]|uniref:F-box domain-containing protein n=1 Tax=Tetrapyrgos nigripes TaxID=182062 RepID=A0A8H5LXG9_9AGAR|nr:hypothetical protein D9758_001577 [Tetrapyrgos nigripes]